MESRRTAKGAILHAGLRGMLAVWLLAVGVGETRGQVELCRRWVATVDSATQKVRLEWSASPSVEAAGYNICTGDTCRHYATLSSPTDTTLLCTDHTAEEEHRYRLYVFDTAGNPSQLTPPFGNIVLRADMPECSTAVEAWWNRYEGMPGGVGRYTLYAILEPFINTYEPIFSTDSLGPTEYSFIMPEGVTRASLRMCASSTDGKIQSFSNTISVQRRTVDSAAFVRIDSLWADSIRARVLIWMGLDSTFAEGEYTVWRSIDGSPWNAIGSFSEPRVLFEDMDIEPLRDSLHCYQLSVRDACGLNPKYSQTKCIVVPSPPEPACYFPTVIVLGDEENGHFLPRVQGMKGDLYELTIYDRRGLIVYHTVDPSAGWRPESSARQGVYTYRLRVRYLDNMIKNYIGTVLLIK